MLFKKKTVQSVQSYHRSNIKSSVVYDEMTVSAEAFLFCLSQVVCVSFDAHYHDLSLRFQTANIVRQYYDHCLD